VVGRCSNPECNCGFREFAPGRLFLLRPMYPHSGSVKLPGYCLRLSPACDISHTIPRPEAEVVVGNRSLGVSYQAAAAPSRRNAPGTSPYRDIR
jgi:hypothetical protein